MNILRCLRPNSFSVFSRFNPTFLNLPAESRRLISTDLISREMTVDSAAVELRRQSFGDLCRFLFILNLCSKNIFSDNCEMLLNTGRRFFGNYLFNQIMKRTFYKHFVIGESEAEVLKNMSCISGYKLNPMIMMGYEDDLGLLSEDEYKKTVNKNQEEFKKVVTILKNSKRKNMIMHFKLTGFFPLSTLRQLSEKVFNDEDYKNLVICIKDLILENKTMEEVFSDFPQVEKRYLSIGIEKIIPVMREIEDSDIKLLVDAEYKDVNTGIGGIVAALALIFNHKRPTIGFTFQCYLKDAMETIHRNFDLIGKFGACCSCKLVRGAYMVSESEKAAKKGLPNPVNDSYELTNKMYDGAVETLFSMNFEKEHHVMVATHNIESVRKACILVASNSQKAGFFTFGQLMGMSEHLSLKLASLNFLVYKSAPYGSVQETIPYLMRRVYENSSIFEHCKVDVILLKRELYRRLRKVLLIEK